MDPAFMLPDVFLQADRTARELQAAAMRGQRRAQAFEYFRHVIIRACERVVRSFADPPLFEHAEIHQELDTGGTRLLLQLDFSNHFHERIEMDADLLREFYAEQFRQHMITQTFGVDYGSEFGRYGAAAEKRAEKLLREWLSPAQRAQFDKDGTFDVVGCHSGKTYRIRACTSFNVDQLGRRGKVKATYCFQPEGVRALGDIMLAQKIALETDERAALEVANIAPASAWGVGTAWGAYFAEARRVGNGTTGAFVVNY